MEVTCSATDEYTSTFIFSPLLSIESRAAIQDVLAKNLDAANGETIGEKCID